MVQNVVTGTQFVHNHIRTYVHTYVHTHVRTWMLSEESTYILSMYIHTYVQLQYHNFQNITCHFTISSPNYTLQSALSIKH